MSTQLRELNPTTTFWISIGLAITAGVVVTGYALRARARAKKPLPKAKGIPPKQAVTAAIDQLGRDAHPYALTDFAYVLAYPECPTVPDEKNPEHDRCRGLWLEMAMRVRDRLGLDPDEPIEPKPSVPKNNGLAKSLCDYFDSLTEKQRTGVRSIIGAERHDKLLDACEADNDAVVRAQILTLRKDVEKLFKDDPLGAYMLYRQLQDVLGEEKVEEFLDIIK